VRTTNRFFASSLLLVACLAPACGPTSHPGNPDGSVDEPDGAPPPPESDASLADAATTVPDAYVPPPTPDAAPPPIYGLSWPADQVFPSFAPVQPLDVIAGHDRPADVESMIVTLEGLVNRKQPRIYVDYGGTTDTLWLNEIGVAHTAVSDPFALVSKYASEIAGIVITDPAQPDTLNLATTIAGQRDGIVASPALAATLTGTPYGLPVLEDLRSHHFGSNLDVYQYLYDHYSAGATHRMIHGLDKNIPGHLRDYAVATRAMMVWLNPANAAEKALLERFFDLLPPNSPYMGWWPDEPVGVRLASTHGVVTYAADWSANLTVLGGTPRGNFAVPTPPAPPPLENKVYVSIFMSDGDNLQEDQGLIPLKWANGDRGVAPTAWTVSPALVDVAPVILRYFWRTATLHDVLVSGPSGLGYTYPDAWPAGAFTSYTQVTGRYMQAAGLRVTTLWNNGADLRDADALDYLHNVPGLVGLTIQDASSALKMIGGVLPLLRMQLSYGDTESIVWSGIDSALPSYTGAAPIFVAVQGNMNMGTINPTAFRHVQERYGKNHNVVFVRPDHFFQLLARSRWSAAHVMLTGDFDGDHKTDQFMYYGGNGDFWVGRSTGAMLDWHRAATTSFGNLADHAHRFEVADYNGDGKSDVAVYAQSGDSWRVGISDGTSFTFGNPVGGVGDLLGGARRLSVGDYTGDGKADLLVYDRGDGSLRLGVSTGTSFAWRQVASVGGFGNLLDGSHMLYDGDFNGDGKRDLAFYYNGNGDWFVGLSDGNAITFHNAGNTSNFGDVVDGSHGMVVGDWNGDHKTDVMFHYSGNGDWWMGLSDGNVFDWHRAATTDAAMTGNALDLRHRMYVGDADGDGKSDVWVYDTGSGAWWRGRSDGTSLAFALADQTGNFGDLVDPSRQMFFGDYDGDGKTDTLFYYEGDGNWWLRKSGTGAAVWGSAGNTSGFGALLH
jgi:hypothetical protein